MTLLIKGQPNSGSFGLIVSRENPLRAVISAYNALDAHITAHTILSHSTGASINPPNISDRTIAQYSVLVIISRVRVFFIACGKTIPSNTFSLRSYMT